MFVVVTYDVVEDRRRNKVMKTLKGYGRHVQKSVFECHLDPPRIEAMVRKLSGLIDPQKDSVRIYVIPPRALRKVIALGVGEVTREEKVVVV
jgi:CRISPR-associated protein Cas2